MNEDSFFSIDRLLEFGLSMAVAQQMANSMNEGITRMNAASQFPQTTNNQQPHYFVIFEGKQAGPFSEQELFRLINEKKVTKESYVWKPGMSQWLLAENFPEVLKLVALSPPPFEPTTNSR